MQPAAVRAIVLAVALAGCAASLTQPDVDAAAVAAEHERQADLLAASIPEAVVIRSTVDPDLRRRTAKVLDALLPAALPLCTRMENRCFFAVTLGEKPIANAYATGENDITVYAGLLGLLETDDELAFVLAHEIGHHLADHLAETKRRANLGGMIGGVLFSSIMALAGADLATQTHAVDTGHAAGFAVGSRVHSKDEEREADYIAAYLAARAGYDPAAGLTLLDRLARLSGSAALRDGFLATHPSTPDRAARLRATLAEIAQNQRLGADLLPNGL
jgi:predicted Zn-dependent protease